MSSDEAQDQGTRGRHEQLLQAFSYHVKQGGFAQLLFNARGEGLAEYEEMLIAVGAPRAQAFYVRAIRSALADTSGYEAFLADWNAPAGLDLRSSLQLLSIEYLTGEPSIDDETQAWSQG